LLPRLKAKIDLKLKKMSEEIHSIRSELGETSQHLIKNIMTCVNHVTKSLQKEMTERIEKTRVELQAVEMSRHMGQEGRRKLGKYE
jgi:hypothetical protein